MQRRAFLGSILALAVAPAIVRAASIMPVRALVPLLWGDGIHNDTAALQALLDLGESISGGSYRISDTLIVRNDTIITNSSFKFAKMPIGKSAIFVPQNAKHWTVDRNYFDSAPDKHVLQTY